jgi:putative oxidoreductase
MKHFIETQDHWVGLIIRLTIGLVMLPHGAQKLLGMFGGAGYKATMDFLINTMNLPWIISFAIIIIEFFGAVALITGFASRMWAICFIVVMIGAIATVNIKNGFFMNWFGNQSGEGYEYHLLIIGLSLALLFTGSGKFSIDRLIQH